MILTEYYTTRKDGVKLYKTYSSQGYYIKQLDTGYIYDTAIDVETSKHVYVETEDKIEEEQE